MASIILADDGIAFDGMTVRERPLGGAESAFVWLAEALAKRGHQVQALARDARAGTVEGVAWAPVGNGLPDVADLYIANRSSRLLGAVPHARAMAFWLHNNARYLMKARYLWPLFRRKPSLVFLSRWHAGTYPAWAPGGERFIVPLGLAPEMLAAPKAIRTPPGPKAVFLSNPLQGLARVLDIWEEQVAPVVKGAELYLYSGAATYGAALSGKQAAVEAILDRARGLADKGVRLNTPLPRGELVAALQDKRLFLHGGGDPETFCLAAAETQALGIPGVAFATGALPDRIADGMTGFVVADGDGSAFGHRAVALLTDDALWRRQHEAALAPDRRRDWDAVAQDFERLLV